MESPFDVLALDSDADEEEIKQAYQERVKDAHPDHGGSVEEFRAVRTAYEELKAGYEPKQEELKQAEPKHAEPNQTEPRQTKPSQGTTARDRTGNRAQGSEQTHQSVSEVTYLNYDVLTDFGWGTDDDNLFEKAASADLDEVDYGQFRVQPGQSLLEAAEDEGFAWPFACRGGACANCAIMLLDGELSMPASHVLPTELMERGIRLSCNGMPISDELKVLYNVKHMPELDDLLLPPDPFEHRYPDD